MQEIGRCQKDFGSGTIVMERRRALRVAKGMLRIWFDIVVLRLGMRCVSLVSGEMVLQYG